MRQLTLLSALLAAPLSLAQTAPPQTTPPQTSAVQTTPFTLQDALAGLGTSSASRQLQLALQSAQVQAQAAQASTGFTAGVSGSAGYNAGGSSGTVTTGSSVSASVGISASLPVLPWAAATLGAQSAARSLKVAQVTYAQGTAALKTSLEQAYGRAVTAQLNLAAVGSTLALVRRQLAQVTAFQAENNATAVSVQTAQAALQTAQTSLQGAQNEFDSARRALGTLTGRDLAEASFSPDLSAALAGAALPGLPAALAAAQDFSPALAGARKAVADAQASVSSAERARRLPAATLSADYGPGSSGSRSGLSSSLNLQSGVASVGYTQPIGGSVGSSSFSLGLSASFNVLDPAADGALKVAQLGLQQSQLALVVQQASLIQSLQDSYSAAALAASSVLPRQTGVAAYTTAVNVARDRLAAGLATETDVLNAEIALAQAVRDLNSAQISALITSAQLSALTGLTGAP